MNRQCLSAKWLCFAILLCFSASLFAQSDFGSIQGFVKDPSGATIPAAKITARNQAGIERQTSTNESGYFTITNIPAGIYTVTIEAPGFKKYESSNNKLDAASVLGLDATLTLGAASETVEVSATATQLQTETATVQKLVTRQQIDALELNGRNPVNLSAPGAGCSIGQPGGLVLLVWTGPVELQRFAQSGKPDHL